MLALKFELQALVAPRGNFFWQSVLKDRNILSTCLIGLLMKMVKKNVDRLFDHLGYVFGRIWGSRLEPVGVFVANVTLALLIDP